MVSTTRGILIGLTVSLLGVPLLAFGVQYFLTVSSGSSSSASADANLGSGEMFDLIAGRYDLINRVLAMRMDINWRKVMVERIKRRLFVTTENTNLPSTGTVPFPSHHILDIATGTADVAIQLATAMPSVFVLGIDPSNNMLEIGRDKVRKESSSSSSSSSPSDDQKTPPSDYPPISDRIRLNYGAVEDFSRVFPTTTTNDTTTTTTTTATATTNPMHVHEHSFVSFDAATMAFGIRNVVDRPAALCEIHRVLKDHGTLCILEFSEPEGDAPLERLARLFIRHVVPVVGGLLSGAPREYLHLQNSIKNFPTPKEFVRMMETTDCRTPNRSGGDMPHHDDDDDIMADDSSMRRGPFRVDELIQMNFGSVQLYVATAINKT